MANRPPSGYAVHHAVLELAQVREMLFAIDPTIEDDERLFADMLDAEGGGALQVIERLIEASVESDALADAAKLRQADLAERRARFERRRDAYRAVALQAMEQINLKRLERPTFTASIRALPPPVHIDENTLQERWFRIKREPMKSEIRKALLDGVRIEGAQFGNAATGITVRTK